MDKEYVTHMHTHVDMLFILQKEGNSAFCDHMYETGGHYTKWNKPDAERQLVHDLIETWNLK